MYHRCLLILDGSGRWVCCTPNFDYMITDLSEHRVVPLERNRVVPDRYHGQLYMFDRNGVDDAVLEEMHRRARSLASLLGFRQAAGTSPGRWVVSDTAHQAFGEEVPAEICNVDTEFVAKGATALVRIDAVWTTTELVSEDAKEFEEWKAGKAQGPGRDIRLAQTHFDGRGARHLAEGEALNLYKSSNIAH